LAFGQKEVFSICGVRILFSIDPNSIRGDQYKISPYHVLWPIPRPAILANSLGQINQNLGYAGSETNKPALDKIQE